MTIYVLAGLLVISMLALVHREDRHSKHLAEREKTWDLERGALLSRIQHPEVYVPPTLQQPELTQEDQEKLVLAEKELAEDESDLVGVVMDGNPENLDG